MNASSRRISIRCFDVVESTNDTILAAGARGEPEGTTHVSREQTRGRGRADRRWWSPRDSGLWMSTLLRPTTGRARWSGISLVAGAAIHDTLRDLGVAGVSLYWPNDLQLGQKKLAGILCEARTAGDESWVALGIGMNIDLDPGGGTSAAPALPPDLRGRITSLVEAGPPRTRDPLRIASEVLERFFPAYDRFLSGESVRDVVGDRLAHQGGRVRVRNDPGASIDGTIEGLSEDGRLLVRLTGVELLESGQPGARLPPGVLPTPRSNVVAIMSGDVEYVE